MSDFWSRKLGQPSNQPQQPARAPVQPSPAARPWWDTSPAPQPPQEPVQPQPGQVWPQEQGEYRPRQAKSARLDDVCPDCSSGNYMSPPGTNARLRCFDCFAGSEKYITRDGLRTFAETVGTKQEVLNAKGQWVPAEIQQFGTQHLVEIAFRPGNVSRSPIRHRVRATATHRWITHNRGEVQDLRVGDQVAFVGVSEQEFISEAFIYGFGFGDGTVDSAGRARLELCGGKVEKYLNEFQEFGGCSISFPPSLGGSAIITFRKRKFADWKNLPDVSQKSADWLASWLEGYLAADGHYKKSEPGVRFLDSQNSAALDLATEIAPLAGYVVTGRSAETSMETNFGKRKSPLERLKLRQKEFFRVTEVTDLGIAEEVFCAVVPDGHEFVLANGIHTGNCGFPFEQTGSSGISTKGGAPATPSRQIHDGSSNYSPTTIIGRIK